MQWLRRTTPSPTQGRAAYLSALRAEIRILIRAIVGDPDKNLSALKVNWRENDQDITLDYPRVVELIAQPDPSDDTAVLARIGQMQAVRDSLSRLTKPATGYSIAYTSLVVGNERGVAAESTYELAKQAYGGLTYAARLHRWFIRFLTVAAVLIAIFASWEATKASLGRNLLQVLEPLRAQQITLATDKYKLETGLILSKEANRTALNPICVRYEMALQKADPDGTVPSSLLPSEAAAQIREICGRDQILAQNFKIAHAGLRFYLLDWPDMVGGLYAPIAHLVDTARHAAAWVGGVASANVPSPDYARPPVVTEMQCRNLCFGPGGHGFARPWDVAVGQGSGSG